MGRHRTVLPITRGKNTRERKSMISFPNSSTRRGRPRSATHSLVGEINSNESNINISTGRALACAAARERAAATACQCQAAFLKGWGLQIPKTFQQGSQQITESLHQRFPGTFPIGSCSVHWNTKATVPAGKPDSVSLAPFLVHLHTGLLTQPLRDL